MTSTSSEPYKGRNRLSEEKSPYLQQHQDNPVWWWAWNEEAFETAAKLDLPIFLSIGYSTCHWCHVMEHESFEDKEVAQFLNSHFVSIKVDREELPDVDKVYMNALQVMTGRGGWPLSAFLTHDRKPFYAGTYFPKDTFLEILERIIQVWSESPEKILSSASAIGKHLKQIGTFDPTSYSLGEDSFRQLLSASQKSFDPKYAGFGPAPKFPPSMRLRILFRIHQRTNDSSALKMAEDTLRAMAHGGIYDHLGGGFHRYSVDAKWLVPHFEKMLYDNALLATSYLEAYQITKIDFYKEVATETLDYILRDMAHSEGGYFSAEDADSEGEEGKYYTWGIEELQSQLSDQEYEAFVKQFGVSSFGNFEHATNILFLPSGQSWEGRFDTFVKSAREKLLLLRNKRIRPLRDEKILTSWNGLMMAAMAFAYRTTGNSRYLHSAQRTARFLRSHLWKDGVLYRRYLGGETKYVGFLDDYSYLISGLIELYQSDFDEDWIEWAQQLQEAQEKMLSCQDFGGFEYTSNGLLMPLRDYVDSAEPNPQSVSVLNLLRLYSLTLDNSYKERALKVLQSAPNGVSTAPSAYSELLRAVDFLLAGPKEVAVIPGDSDEAFTEAKEKLWSEFAPHVVFSSHEDPKRSRLPVLQSKTKLGTATSFYVCEEQNCKQPTQEINLALRQMKEVNHYLVKK